MSDTPSTESATPRTDKEKSRSEKYDGEEIPGYDYVPAEFSEQLEKELSALSRDLAAQDARVKELEALLAEYKTETGCPLCKRSEATIAQLQSERDALRVEKDRWQEGRQQGREEALQILLLHDPEMFPDHFQGSASLADTGDYTTHWKYEELAKLLKTTSRSALFEELDGATQKALYDTIELTLKVEHLQAERDALASNLANSQSLNAQLMATNGKVMEERDAWQRDAEAFKEQLSKAENHAGSMAKEYDAQVDSFRALHSRLTSEVEQLRKDGERLDWLETKHPASMRAVPYQASKGKATGSTLRSAIDAAMSQGEEQG